MVKMENITQEGNIVSMDCYIEGHMEDHFRLVIDITNMNIVSNTLNEMNTYVAHARYYVKRMIEQNKSLPCSNISMWY